MQHHLPKNETQPTRISYQVKSGAVGSPGTTQYQEQYDEQDDNHPSADSRLQDLPQWKRRIQRNKQRKQIFGEHYNYNYKKPNQHKMYRIQETHNTEIERANRILLEKIQSIFKRSMGKRRKQEIEDRDHQIMEEIAASRAERARSGSKRLINSIQGQLELEQHLLPHKQGRKSMNQIGELNKNIRVAREEARDTSKKSDLQMNRKLVKLQQIQNGHIQRRRVHTDIAQSSAAIAKNNNIAREKAVTSGISITPHAVSNHDNQATSAVEGKKKTNRTRVLPVEDPLMKYEGGDEGLPKIVLLKTVLIINSTPYTLEMSVEKNTYMITAISNVHTSQPSGVHPSREIISMPYSDYQRLYRQKLGQCHENIVQYLEVENGLIKIKGFESHLMDVFQYGQVVMQGNSDQINATGIERARKIVLSNSREDGDNQSSNSKRIIVHYSNGNYNGEDPFDRLTVAQSQINKMNQRDTGITPTPIEQNSHHFENKDRVIPKCNEVKNCIPTMTEPLLNSNVTSKSRLVRHNITSNQVNLLILPSDPHNLTSNNHSTNVTEQKSASISRQMRNQGQVKKQSEALQNTKSQDNLQLHGTNSQRSQYQKQQLKNCQHANQQNGEYLSSLNHKQNLQHTRSSKKQDPYAEIEAIIEDN